MNTLESLTAANNAAKDRAVSARDPNITIEQLDVALTDPDWRVRFETVGNINITPKQLGVALNDVNWHVRTFASVQQANLIK